MFAMQEFTAATNPVRDTDWQIDALCNDGTGALAELFFSEQLDDIAAAKAFCQACPVKDNCVQAGPSPRRADAMGPRPAADIEHGLMPREIDAFRPRQGCDHAATVHDAGEGARQVGLLLMRRKHLSAAPIGLRSICQYRLFQAVKRPHGIMHDRQVQISAEVHGAAFEQIIFRQDSECVAVLLHVHQPEGDTHC